MELSKSHGHVYFVINDSEYKESKSHLDKFLTVTYHMSGNVVKYYDLKPHEITGNHKDIQLETPAFKPKTEQSTDIRFENFILNNEWTRMAIEQKATDVEIREILESLSNDFSKMVDGDPVMEAEFMAIILGNDEQFQKVFDKIRQLRDQ